MILLQSFGEGIGAGNSFDANEANRRGPNTRNFRPPARIAHRPRMLEHPRNSALAENSTPILVGCGEVTDLTTPVEAARSPFDLIAQAGRLALTDAGAANLAQAIDTVAMVRLFSDSSHRFATKL